MFHRVFTRTKSLNFSDASIRSETDASNSSNNPKDELTDILGPNFNLESMVQVTGRKIFC